MKEIWKDVVGFEGVYQVSNTGIVRRIYPNKTKTLKQSRAGGYTNREYLYVNMSANGKYRCSSVHRLVAEAFCKKGPRQNEVDHINNNKADNRASNLRWVTRKQNNSRLHARRMKSINAACESHADEYLEIAFADGTIKVFDTFKEAAQFIGCSKNFLYIVAKHSGGHTKKFDLKLVKRYSHG